MDFYTLFRIALLFNKHFWCGLLVLIVGGLLLLKGGKSADNYMDIMGPIMLISIVGTFLFAIFQSI